MKTGFFLRVLIFFVVMAVLIGLPLLVEGSAWHSSGMAVKGPAPMAAPHRPMMPAAECQMFTSFDQEG
jgi:hypothetical protein